MTITIEDFKPSDLKRCLEIRIQNYKEVNKTPEKIAGVRDYFLSSMNVRKYFVAKDGDLIVGMGGYHDNQLYSFFIDPAYHGRGIGKLILQRVLSEIEKLGYKDAVLLSSKYAKSFYEKFGFVAEKKQEDGYFMKKDF